MRRPIVRFLLTLLAAASILGSVPATSEAGIVPWAWDTLFGPVGSIQARRASYYGGGYYGGGYSAGCCYGPSVGFVGFRGWRKQCCGDGYGSYYGGYDSGCGCSTCGSSCSSCGTGGCSTGCCGYDSGYACGPNGCGVGGCASGQCNVNYPPGTVPPAGSNGASPVTPAAPPAQGGPSPRSGDTSVIPPAPPVAPNPDNTTDGFQPARKGPAPAQGDPTQQEEKYIPPKVNDGTGADGAGSNAAEGAESSTDSTTSPAVPAAPNAIKKRPSIGGDDEKDEKQGSRPGPRLEMHEKITLQRTIVRVRQAQAPVRVSASANRTGMFPKVAWRNTVDTEIAKK